MYLNGKKISPTIKAVITPSTNPQKKTVNPTVEEQIISPDSGYDSLSEVIINPVTNQIDNNIISNNINNNITILNVKGNYVGDSNNYIDYINCNFNEINSQNIKNIKLLGPYGLYSQFNVSTVDLSNSQVVRLEEYCLPKKTINLILPKNITFIYGNLVQPLNDTSFEFNLYFNGNLNDWVLIEKETNLTYLFTSNMIYGKNKIYFEDINGNIIYNNKNYSEITSLNLQGILNIPKYCFSSFHYLTDITLDENTIDIAEGAFSNCIRLQSITIPNNINILNKNTFKQCDGLTTINLNNKLKKIDDEVFNYCSNLISLNLPDGLEYLGYQSVCNCKSLINLSFNSGTKINQSFAVLNSLENIYYNGTIEEWINWFQSFNNSYDYYYSNPLYSAKPSNFYIEDINGNISYNNKNYTLVRDIVIDNNITNLKDYTFLNFAKIRNVTLNSNIKSIGGSCFKNCKELKNINLENISTLSIYSFQNCISLESVTLTSSTSLGSYCFYGCTSLTNVILASTSTGTLYRIPSYFLGNCTSLQEIDIPKRFNTLDYNAFNGCENLTTLIIEYGTSSWTITIENAPSSNRDGLFANLQKMKDGLGFIYVPDVALSRYKSDFYAYRTWFKPISELPQ